MPVFPFVIVSLCSFKLFGVCSEILAQTESKDYVTPNNLHNEQIYLETVEIPTGEMVDPSVLDEDYNEMSSYAEYFVEQEFVISDPVFENSSNINTSAVEKLGQEQSRKRDIPVRGLSHENKMKILQLHNLYRSNVTPPAGNMAYMVSL